jgi:hypothetical protein
MGRVVVSEGRDLAIGIGANAGSPRIALRAPATAAVHLLSCAAISRSEALGSAANEPDATTGPVRV